METGTWKLPKDAVIQKRIEVLTAHLTALTAKHSPITYAVVEIPQIGIREGEEVVDTDMGLMRQKKVYGSIQSQCQLWGYHGAMVAVLSALHIPRRYIGVKEWRKHTLGNGNIKGQQAKAECMALMKKLGIYYDTHNAAEAGGMLFYANGHFRRWLQEDELLKKSLI